MRFPIDQGTRIRDIPRVYAAQMLLSVQEEGLATTITLDQKDGGNRDQRDTTVAVPGSSSGARWRTTANALPHHSSGRPRPRFW